ncbi:MAG: MocR-like pyridoxine biosynthesis transcription factor PdxR [Pseudomarimonas sp.]
MSNRLVQLVRTPWLATLPQRQADEPLQRWIYRGLRGAIIDGRLGPGAAVPSSRGLAASLGVSRGTVVIAYQQLIAEGYLEARPGAGMRVSTQVPDTLLSPGRAARAEVVPPPSAPRPVFSPFLGSLPTSAFAPHRCETRSLPFDLLRRLHSRLLRRSNRWLFEDGPAAGLPALRQAIAEHLTEARGLTVDREQVLVVSSMQQALDIALRVLSKPGESVWLEDPGYPGARHLVQLSGRVPVFVPVDAEGLQVDAGIAQAPQARLAYVTPSRQAPLGVAMSPLRRAQLLAWARRHSAMVFEDDYDSEYRYRSRPVPPLAAEDPERVWLAGSFGKLLYPGLRISYLVCPPGWTDMFAATLSLAARHPNLLTQAVLATFIAEGHFGRHVRRMRRVYVERAAALEDRARRLWAGLLELPAMQAGLDVTGQIAFACADRDAALSLRAHGVASLPLSGYCAASSLPPGLVLGFGAVDEAELDRAAPQVARALEAMRIRGNQSGAER